MVFDDFRCINYPGLVNVLSGCQIHSANRDYILFIDINHKRL